MSVKGGWNSLVCSIGCFAIGFSALATCVAQADEAASHRILCADSSKARIAIIDEAGKLEWEKKIGPLHDLHLLSNGNVLMQTSWTDLVEVEPSSGKVVWQYNSAKAGGNEGKPVEVHAFQRLENGLTMIAESGPARIIEVDKSGAIQQTVKLKVSKPHPHRDTRLVRKLANGNYLVCHEGDGLVREYASDGSTVWEYNVPLFDKKPADGHGVEAWGNQCYCALRLVNGNTLISTGNGHAVIEVTPDKKIVWHLAQNDLPGIKLAWVTTLQVLPTGNIVLGNCHAGSANPQVIEVTRDKQVVWKFHDFDRFGDSFTNTQVLSVNGASLISKPGSER